MNEPKRWSEPTGGASPEESEILLAGVSERMPSELRGQVWSAIALGAAGGAAASALGAATQTSAATAETAASASVASKGLALSSSSIIKGVIAIAVLGGAGVGAMQIRSLLRAPEPSQQSSAHSGTPSHAVASAAQRDLQGSPPALGIVDDAHSAVGSAAQAPASVAAASPPPSAHSSKSQALLPARRTESDTAPSRASDASAASDISSRLREESAAVLAIRRTLLAGNAQQALALLARAAEAFPHGALAEEREALSVRALMGAGQTEAARLRGAAFLQRFPRSPHAGDVRRLLGSP